jgi:hypothetical protein
MIATRLRWVLPLAALLLLILAAFLQSKRLPTTFITVPAAAQSMGAAGEWTSVNGNTAAAGDQAPTPVPSSAATPLAVPQQIVLETMDGAYTDDQLKVLHDPLAEALRYVEERTSMQLKEPVTVLFSSEQGCNFNGVAYTDIRRIILYVCPDIALERATAILAHEFVHQLAADHYGEPHYDADLMLSEGLAQWGTGRYTLGDLPDFRTLIQQNYPNDLLPLAIDSREVESYVIVRHLYDQWASYVEWIIATEGRAAFDALYVDGQERQPGSAPYERVLGMPLDTAEQQWQAWLEH